jgi:hypothetical protein
MARKLTLQRHQFFSGRDQLCLYGKQLRTSETFDKKQTLTDEYESLHQRLQNDCVPMVAVVLCYPGLQQLDMAVLRCQL